MLYVKKIGKFFLGLAIIAGLLPFQPADKAFASVGTFVSQVSAGGSHSLA